MLWSLNIQSAINQEGGISCGIIYFTGTHFTVPVTLTREHTEKVESIVRSIIERHKQPGYTYTVNYITKPKNLMR